MTILVRNEKKNGHLDRLLRLGKRTIVHKKTGKSSSFFLTGTSLPNEGVVVGPCQEVELVENYLKARHLFNFSQIENKLGQLLN